MLNIRLANINDMKKVFDLSNDDLVRQNSIHSEKIEWDNHVKWFQNKIVSPDSVFYIAELENKEFIGYCRLDEDDNEWVITIHISPKCRNIGYGEEIVKFVLNNNPEKNITAFIKNNNESSYKMFLKCKFKFIKEVEIKSIKLRKMIYRR